MTCVITITHLPTRDKEISYGNAHFHRAGKMSKDKLTVKVAAKQAKQMKQRRSEKDEKSEQKIREG